MISLVGGVRLWVKASGHNEKPSGAVTEYEYKYSATMVYPLTWYLVQRDSTGRATLHYSTGEAEITILRIPDDVFGRIADIAAEYKLHKQRESYQPRTRVMDGNSWSAHIRYGKGGIYSSGNNANPPERLYAGIKMINDTLRALIDAATEADVIGHDDHDSLYRRKYL